jgi:FtsH-binding integral membrane protein
MNRSTGWEASGTSNPAITRFFNAVYSWMAVGLAVTGIVAWLVSQNFQIVARMGAGIWLLFIAQIALVVVISRAVNRINSTVATGLFLLYAALNGLTLSVIFLMYAKAAIASAFIVTAGTFGVMSAYGALTKRDLSGVGHFLYMVLIGLVIASIVSIFWHSSALQVIINYVGVFVFVGLTAYDTQKLKAIAYQTQDNPAMASRLSVVGSLVLYLDFINLFLFILQLMNDRRS